MRLLIPCLQCSQEPGHFADEIDLVEYRDDGCYEITCAFGHTTVTVLQSNKFEVLFDIGAHAILDGYYREAISSFTSSLERFYEYAVRIFLGKSSGSDDLFLVTWKEVSSQSERQLGAFIFLWATYCNEPASLLPQSMTKLRNAVIHKGKIPTREEAVEYGNAVLEVLVPKYKLIKERFEEQVVHYDLRQMKENASKAKAVIQHSTLGMASIIEATTMEPCIHKNTMAGKLDAIQGRHERAREGSVILLRG
ncbi:hypothetical protein [Pseudomonas sp. P1.31]|uniref:hypothetical protein n=1 Tax=Pseudomonas sp. P1.31 TaxID=1699311 RepID=UPI00069FF5DE|nr:hypothetical protein [Pseudomonas sp. P1.31]